MSVLFELTLFLLPSIVFSSFNFSFPPFSFSTMAYNQQQQPNVAWYDSGASASAAGGASAYGGGGAATMSDARQRPSTFAPPAPAFVPPPSSQPHPSFDSYDAAGGPSGYGGYSTDPSDRGTTGPGGGFEDEPPLLEELGIDVSGIVRRSVAVLTGRASAAVGGAAGVPSSSSSENDGPDLGGPLLFLAALGATHLLASKLHFGVILGWTVVGSSVCWVVAGNLAEASSNSSTSTSSSSPPPHGGNAATASSAVPLPPAVRVGLYETTCLVGYGMLPLVLASAAALLLPNSSSSGNSVGAARTLLVGGAALWSSRCASRLFAARWPALRGSAGLVAYPCAMLYGCLALLTLYSRNGSGSGKGSFGGNLGGGGGGGAMPVAAPLVPPPPPSLVPPPPPPPVLTT